MPEVQWGNSDVTEMTAGANGGLTNAGFLGSEQNRTFTTMDDPANLTARRQGRPGPHSVLVAQMVREQTTAAGSQAGPIGKLGWFAVIAGDRDQARARLEEARGGS